MKTIKSKVLLKPLLILAISLIVITTSTLAADLNIETDDLTFEIIPQDQELFNILNMSPGDSISTQLTITNNFENEVEISMRSERLDEEPEPGAPDLYKQIKLRVSFDGEVIHDGQMIDFASDNGINLGFWDPGEVKELMIDAILPEETGNEFMGLTHNHRWIFTVGGEEIVLIDDEEPPLGPMDPPEDEVVIIEDEEVPIGEAKLPKTGGTPAVLFFIAGAAIVSAGVVLKKKGSTNNNLGPNKFK